MTSPTVAVQSTASNTTPQGKKEGIVKLDYVLTSILWVTSYGQTLESTETYRERPNTPVNLGRFGLCRCNFK